NRSSCLYASVAVPTGFLWKKRLSKWIIEAITLAYSFLGLQCPLGVKAHSTRGVASSWAWSS
ncbi:hypothetical protein M9458_056062, partial [Cirrhinus mrigala]